MICLDCGHDKSLHLGPLWDPVGCTHADEEGFPDCWCEKVYR